MAYTTILGSHTLAESRGYLNNNFAALAGLSYGASAPSPTYPYMFWADTGSQTLKQRTAADDGWLILGQLGQNYWGLLSLSGGTLTGPLDMDGNKITGLPEGTDPTDAARVQELNIKADLDAPAFTGDATVDQDPVGSGSIVPKGWAQAQFMTRSGGTFTGPALGVTSADAAAFLPRSVIEALTTFHTTTGHRHTGADARKIRGSDLDVINGIVGSDGTIERGSGFTCVRASTGSYNLTWSPALSARPIVILTAEDSHVACVFSLTTSGCNVRVLIQTYYGSGLYYLALADHPFHILAIP